MAEEIIIKVDGLQELKNIEATFKTFVTSINAAVTAIGAAGGTNSLSGAIGKVTAETKKHSQAIDENKVKQQQLNAIEKERIIASSEYSKATEKLLAQTKILQREIDALVKSGQTESALYREKTARLANMTQEYDRLQKATGLAQMKQTGMYGATYQLSQVMRELPNFAIDARIGFLSLSNNLPMLLDSFKQLSMEIDSVTGKQKGFKGAFAAFGKSLLSLNTAFVIGTTLLTIYGEKIITFIGNLFKANNAVGELNDSINELNKSVSGKLSSDMEKAMQFAINYNTAIKNGNKERIKELSEIGRKEYGMNQERLNMIANNVNSWRDAFAQYLELARKTYWNEARIKAGIDAEMAAKTAFAQRTLLEKEIKSKYGEDMGGFYIQQMKKDINYIVKTPQLWGESLLKEWIGLNEQIDIANKKVKTLSSIPVFALAGQTTTQTPDIAKPKGETAKRDKDIGYLFGWRINKKGEKTWVTEEEEAKMNENLKSVMANANTEMKNILSTQPTGTFAEEPLFSEDKIQSMLSIMQSVGTITDSIAGLYDARIQKMNDYYDMEAARIEGSTMSEQQKNEALKRLDEKRYQEELKLFEQRKKFQIATVWIDAAAGIMNAWTTKSTTPSPWDVIERVAKSAAIVAMAVTQTANINAQKPNAPKSISSGGSATGMTATQKVMSPQKTAMTSSEENLNMMLSNREKVTSVVKVSEINNVQNRVAVRENNQMY